MTAAPAAPPGGALPRPLVLSYATGAVGTGVFSTVPGLLLLFYLTDVVGVAAGIASLVLLLPKAWDAVLNPVVGTLSDRTRHAWGPRRPYLLAGAVVVPVGFALLFAAPELGPGATALWVGAAYVLAMTGFALFQVPWVAMPAEMTGDYHERTRLMSTRMVLLTVGILLGGGLAPVIAGGEDAGRGGYRLMGVVLGVVLAAALLTAWWGTRTAAHAAPATGPRPGVAEQLAVVRANPAFTALLSGFVLQAVAVGALLAATPYLATYALGDADLAALLFVALVVPSAAALPLWRRLSLRTGKLRGLQLASVVFGVGALGLVLARDLPTGAVLATTALLGVGYAGMQLFPYAMLPDALERSGPGRAGVLTGVWQAGETLGLAIGPAVYALVLAATGFVSSAADERVAQPSSALTGLVVGASVLPALLVAASLALLRRYTDVRATADPTTKALA